MKSLQIFFASSHTTIGTSATGQHNRVYWKEKHEKVTLPANERVEVFQLISFFLILSETKLKDFFVARWCEGYLWLQYSILDLNNKIYHETHFL